MRAAADPAIQSLLLAGLWLALACALPRLPRRWQVGAAWLLVLAGVPALGWLTLNWGPGLGVAGFGLGLLMLLARPTARRAPPPASQAQR
ncbi:DUF2484 family protein [Paracoccus hibiscisoli]|uniref:DUF2484 family protein n=1 Tax=Paracoccus hibiscisoli TaxID=2023261 RepID=A0A4U0QMH2_9RHOB|nr:DUF2484 family protein [Paracoccus hibiscisoli]TJZ83037.1 DUF2484 family protein [Paracoccus hibiscisoli]